MTAKCTINGWGFQYLYDTLNCNAFYKLKKRKKRKVHPLNCPSGTFPGLKELAVQDPRQVGTFFEDAEQLLDLEFTDDAISDIQIALVEEIDRIRQLLQESERNPQPLKIINISRDLISQHKELLYFARCFGCDIRPEDEALAQKVMERRLQSNEPGRNQLTTTLPLVPKAARESFKTVVAKHLQTLPNDRWEDLRAYSKKYSDAPHKNLSPDEFDPDMTPERLVQECIMEVSGPLMSDYLKGVYETSALKLGDVEGNPVYYIDAGGFYVYEHPLGYCLQIDITFPATPPNW